MIMPENRWILWADGPLRGPAVRFWTILLVALLAALALGSIPKSPLRRWEWVLLAIGLTQVHLVACDDRCRLALRPRLSRRQRSARTPRSSIWRQVGLVLLTVGSLAVLMFVVGAGLLGHPDMFIVGNGSSRLYLRWFEPRSGPQLPTPIVVSVSVWYYRLLMLFWALWLAASLLRWLNRGWQQFYQWWRLAKAEQSGHLGSATDRHSHPTHLLPCSPTPLLPYSPTSADLGWLRGDVRDRRRRHRLR